MNKIEDEGIIGLSEGLSQLESLEFLRMEIADNSFGDKGTVKLSQG